MRSVFNLVGVFARKHSVLPWDKNIKTGRDDSGLNRQRFWKHVNEAAFCIGQIKQRGEPLFQESGRKLSDGCTMNRRRKKNHTFQTAMARVQQGSTRNDRTHAMGDDMVGYGVAFHLIQVNCEAFRQGRYWRFQTWITPQGGVKTIST
jgi:hypothetical protein